MTLSARAHTKTKKSNKTESNVCGEQNNTQKKKRKKNVIEKNQLSERQEKENIYTLTQRHTQSSTHTNAPQLKEKKYKRIAMLNKKKTQTEKKGKKRIEKKVQPLHTTNVLIFDKFVFLCVQCLRNLQYTVAYQSASIECVRWYVIWAQVESSFNFY